MDKNTIKVYCKVYNDGSLSNIFFEKYGSFCHGDKVAVFELKEIKTIHTNLE